MSEEDKKKIQQALGNNMIKENKQKVDEKKIKEIIDDAKTNIKNEKDDKIEWKPISEFKDENVNTIVPKIDTNTFFDKLKELNFKNKGQLFKIGVTENNSESGNTNTEGFVESLIKNDIANDSCVKNYAIYRRSKGKDKSNKSKDEKFSNHESSSKSKDEKFSGHESSSTRSNG